MKSFLVTSLIGSCSMLMFCPKLFYSVATFSFAARLSDFISRNFNKLRINSVNFERLFKRQTNTRKKKILLTELKLCIIEAKSSNGGWRLLWNFIVRRNPIRNNFERKVNSKKIPIYS